MYTTQTCPWCQRAKVLLDKEGITFEEVDVTTDVALQTEMIEKSGRQSVPQIFISETHIGGYDDLVSYLETQRLGAA
ncbi:MAG: glutaredoxin 3 [Gammaproteobacteria bacterium]